MKYLFLPLFLIVSIFASAQEFGNANSDKKIVVASFDTPFKKAVFTQFAEQMATEGYHTTIVTPDKFTTPAAKTLVIYAEGGAKGKGKGQPWNDALRNYVAKNANAIYFTTFKRGAAPKLAKGVDSVSSASKANVETTVANLVTKVKAKMK